MKIPRYRFKFPNTVLFITGIPLSGKSTVTPLVAADIEGCATQSMDIFRLLSQEFENRKKSSSRNSFVKYGSCDSYQNIGDGKYTPKNLVIGFNKYAEAVSSLLPFVLPKLEAQGVRDMIFEGVQLTPLIVEPYLRNRNKLIILTTNEERLNLNRTKLFGNDRELLERYSTDKLFILQNEILKQSKLINNSSFTLVKNNNDYHTTANVIIEFLEKADVIETLTDNK